MANPWIEFVKSYHKAHPNISYTQALKEAKIPYKNKSIPANITVKVGSKTNPTEVHQFNDTGELGKWLKPKGKKKK